MNTPLKHLLPFLLTPFVVHAADYTWTGAVDNNWDTAGNWSGDGGIPDDGSDLAIFDSSPGIVTLNNQYLTRVSFQTAGWTIQGTGGFDLENLVSNAPLSSSGAGINTLAVTLFPDRNIDVDVSSGNTLVHTGTMSMDASITKTGVGTLILNSSSTTAESSNILVSGGTALINYDQVNSSSNGARPGARDGGTIGGHGTIAVGGSSITSNLQFRVAQSGSGTLSPGGDGTTEGGSIIGTLDIDFANAGSSNVITMYEDSILAIDIDPVSNQSDLVNMFLSGGGSGAGWNIRSGATLDITTVGGSAFDPGDSFIISTFINSAGVADYGQFDSVLINGNDAFLNPEFYIDYNLNSIEVGLIPEPGTYGLISGLFILGLATFRRRQK
tara:strand:- start:57055 stop:58206 length:1152 start_codon:yes stop_codon:yes gene_type:complete